MLRKLHCGVTAVKLTSSVMGISDEDKKERKRLEFGQWLQDKRNRSGHALAKKFAEEIDISAVQLSRIENGTSGISAETLDKAIRILKLDPLEAYEKAGLVPGNLQTASKVPAESVEDALRYAHTFEGRGLSESEIKQLRPLMEILDREIDRLAELNK